MPKLASRAAPGSRGGGGVSGVTQRRHASRKAPPTSLTSMHVVRLWDAQRTDALGGAGAALHVLRDARQAPGMIYSMSSLS